MVIGEIVVCWLLVAMVVIGGGDRRCCGDDWRW